MTPLHNRNDYYKKMFELQERLRKSEEERIRLEERFSMLEHESRSRHEACINRLRMRYIEFLEDQQARDERNHKLLGALDRVDSSLALMTAKTDRLGALRKQYESSILRLYGNRLPNGSVTGDSGVASQNDDRQRRTKEFAGNNNNALLTNRGVSPGRQENGNRSNYTYGQARPGSSYATLPGNRYDNDQILQSTIPSSRLSQGGTSLINARDVSSSSFTNSSNPARYLHTTLDDRRESLPQFLQQRTAVSKNSPSYDYQNSPRNGAHDYSFRNIEATSAPLNLNYAPNRSTVRNLANSGSYDATSSSPRFFNLHPSGYSRSSLQSENVPLGRSYAKTDFDDLLHRNSLRHDYAGSFDDRRISASTPSRSPKLAEIPRQEPDDEDEYVGSVVENELERYIGKIRSLHRDADPRSMEELDHEQNTSGDLLNVTLSDDGLDFPVEEKSRDRAMLKELNSGLLLEKDPIDKTSRSANNRANKCEENSSGRGDSGEIERAEGEQVEIPGRCIDKEFVRAVGSGQQLTSIDSLLQAKERYDDEENSSNEECGLLAKNGISANVAKAESELAVRSRRNIEDIAKSDRNSQENDAGTIESDRIKTDDRDDARLENFDKENVPNEAVENDRVKQMESPLGFKEVDESKHKVVNDEERGTGDHLFDVVEESEPLNAREPETRVEEIISNDEVSADYIPRKSSRDDDTPEAKRGEHAISGNYDEDDKTREHERKIDEPIAGSETGNLNKSRQNSTISSNEVSPTGEPEERSQGQQNEDKESQKLEQYENSSLTIADESVSKLPEKYEEQSREQSNVRQMDSVADNTVDPNIDYGITGTEENYANQENEPYAQGEYPQDPNQQYDYAGNEEYQQDPNEHYQQYDPNNVQYNQDPSGQYQYVDPQYQQYEQDPNQQYVEDPNQQYVEDPNQQYAAEPDQQYPDPNQQYAADLNNQEYAADPNQQYSAESDQQYPDQNQQYVAESDQQYPDQNQQYAADPNNQEYSADPNQQYAADPNQEYAADPNQQYAADPNQAYPGDADQQQYVKDGVYRQDGNQAYPTDTDYVYPEGQEYDPNTAFVQGQSYVKGQEGSAAYESHGNVEEDLSKVSANDHQVENSKQSTNANETKIAQNEVAPAKKAKDVIKSLLDSDTDSTIEKNVSNTESDFDFN